LEALVFNERTAIGLDVHARSVRATALDTVTGEVVAAKLPPGNAGVIDWIGQQQHLGPLAATYEAGPTGFGLARALEAAGIRCVVAAPSKIIRPAGDRVKTDARDALLLARLLRMDELTAVRVPSVTEEDARDLVRARDDARTDLLAARHRLSKLLLRHGIVYEASAWTAAHDLWLRRIRKQGLNDAGRGTLGAFDAAFDAVTLVKARRDRLEQEILAMAADSPFTAMTNRLACLRGIATLTGFALAAASRRSPGSRWPSRSATGTDSLARPSLHISASCPRNTHPAARGAWARSPRPVTVTLADC
jgi:transposase